jgi:ABC-type sugar transport system ATPase subunit
LEAICGLRRIEAGQIRIYGRDVTRFAPGERGIGYVPQDLALFPTMSVRQHLAFAPQIQGCSSAVVKDRIDRWASELGIQTLLDRSIHKLSGGERQRVAMGRALSAVPKVLLLDEPLSALDDQTRREMQGLLRSITRSTGVTTIHVTHQLQEAEVLANLRLELIDGVVSKVN